MGKISKGRQREVSRALQVEKEGLLKDSVRIEVGSTLYSLSGSCTWEKGEQKQNVRGGKLGFSMH